MAILFLPPIWFWHTDLRSAETIAWIAKSAAKHNDPLYGDVFDLGVIVGAVSSVGLWWCVQVCASCSRDENAARVMLNWALFGNAAGQELSEVGSGCRIAV